MVSPHDRSRRIVSRMGLAAAVAALFISVRPVRAQQGTPSITLSAPQQAATGKTTPATVAFTLPAGYTLVGNPRLRVVNAQNKITELLPTFITRVSPNGQGQRQLRTATYAPGTYLVRAEIDYVDATGKRGSAASAVSPLLIPRR